MASQSLIDELTASCADVDLGRRATILARLTNLFISGRAAYDHVRDILRKLLPSVLAYIDQTFDKQTLQPNAMHSAASSSEPAASPDSLAHRIALGADHGGFELKNALAAYLTSLNKFEPSPLRDTTGRGFER